MVEHLHLPGHVVVITAYISTNYSILGLATVHRVTVLELHHTNQFKNLYKLVFLCRWSLIQVLPYLDTFTVKDMALLGVIIGRAHSHIAITSYKSTAYYNIFNYILRTHCVPTTKILSHLCQDPIIIHKKIRSSIF